ncbi:uncharacterized protein [Antedon mediterranea]|uniref:uncharacterized protein n=1 Tax=Antedon mediterranea TaxID=105859 RepID=UPI003AF81A00
MEVSDDKDRESEFLETSGELIMQNEVEPETERTEDFELKYNELLIKHQSLLKEYENASRQMEKYKSDLDKKQKQIEILERDAEIHRKKYTKLESTAAEVERAESNLEHLREILRNSQTLVRERDFEIRDLNERVTQQGKDLLDRNSIIEEQTIKIKDLHNQVRDELKRNEQMEKELDKIPALQKERENVGDSLNQTKKQLEEKKAQLTLARRAIKDHKSKIQNLEEELKKLPEVKEEVNMANHEIDTLKKMMVGKDKLVVQKSQELQVTRDQLENGIDFNQKFVQASYPNGANVKIIKKEQRENTNESRTMEQDNLKTQTPTDGKKRRGISRQERGLRSKTIVKATRLDVDTQPYNYASSTEDKSFSTAINTGNSSFMRLLTNGGFGDDVLQMYDVYNTGRRYSSGHSLKANRSGTSDRTKRSKSCGSFPEDDHNLPSGTLLFEDDFLAAQFLHIGDRVCVKLKGHTVTNRTEGKLYTAIVKFIGKLDRENIDHRLNVGIKLDEPLGDTDGVVRGKRYFRVSPSHGKIIRIIDVVSVLNQKTCSYKLIKELIREHRLQTGTIKTERDRKPCLIRIT